MTVYAKAVTAGRIMAGRAVRLACARHLRDRTEGRARGLRFDPSLAEHAITFFAEFLSLAEGEHAGQPFELQPWQQFIVGSLFGWLGADGHRRFRTAYIEAGKGNGKAISLDTPIPTPAGWTTVGALQPGDLVFDELGYPTEVTFATDPLWGHLCYRVIFSDHTAIVADAEHLWLTHALRSSCAPGEALRGRPRRT